MTRKCAGLGPSWSSLYVMDQLSCIIFAAFVADCPRLSAASLLLDISHLVSGMLQLSRSLQDYVEGRVGLGSN